MKEEGKFVIRPMTIADYSQVKKLWQELFELHPTDSFENTQDFLSRNPGLSFVVTVNEKIVGVVLTSYNGRIGYLCRLAVREKFQKKGLGKKLIEKAEKTLRQRGAKQVFLYCQKELVGFYQKLGYKIEKNCRVMIKDI